MENTLKTYPSGKDIINSNNEDYIFHRINEQDEFLNIKIKVAIRQETSVHSKREDIIFRAVGNLIKQNSFLKLHIELLSEQITDEEYEGELEENSDNYFVNLRPISSEFEYYTLIDILEKFPKNAFSIDEFGDIFGITHDNFDKILQLR